MSQHGKKMNQLLDVAYQGSGSVPLPPQLELARALADTRNQEAAQKGINYVQAIILGIAAVISMIIAIALLVTAGRSETPHVQDGRWYGGWTVLILAFLPLTMLTAYAVYKNQDCQGDLVGAIANNATGKLGRAAQTYQQFAR